MNAFKDRAMDILSQCPSSQARTSLEEMVRYCTERKI